ncbi:MAG: hypothetical protein M3440_08905, partial [Chloroflexota bacterium]|nr:hypothetical protein [Chloroflexota bacterium]
MDIRLREVVTDRELLGPARTVAEAHVADARQHGDEPALVRALGHLGEVDRIAGRLPESEKVLDQALGIVNR